MHHNQYSFQKEKSSGQKQTHKQMNPISKKGIQYSIKKRNLVWKPFWWDIRAPSGLASDAWWMSSEPACASFFHASFYASSQQRILNSFSTDVGQLREYITNYHGWISNLFGKKKNSFFVLRLCSVASQYVLFLLFFASQYVHTCIYGKMWWWNWRTQEE